MAHEGAGQLVDHSTNHSSDHSSDRAADGDASLQVSIDQDLCTGDGLCAQYAPDVFELDVDGLAYVKDAAGDLRLAPDSRVPVPPRLRLEVLDAARDCPGACIHVTPAPE